MQGNPAKHHSIVVDPTGVYGGATISITKILGARGDFLAEGDPPSLPMIHHLVLMHVDRVANHSSKKIQGETIYTPFHMCFDPFPRLLFIKRMRTFHFLIIDSFFIIMQPSLPLLFWTAGTFFNPLQVYLVYIVSARLICTIN